MGELVFVGLGLNDEKGISVGGLEEVKSADSVFMELYTSLLPDFSLERFHQMTSKTVVLIERHQLEEENGAVILQAAKSGKTVFLVPGDPFIATTHTTLRIDAEKRGIKTRVVHGASIISAIISLSGLHNYKFGKTVTVPFKDNFSQAPYNAIAQNKKMGLHTLCLLDLRATERKFLGIGEALEMLLEVEAKRGENVVTEETPALGLARAGSQTPTLKADFVGNLRKFNFGEPPYTLIFPCEFHFMEVEALIAFAGAPVDFRRLIK